MCALFSISVALPVASWRQLTTPDTGQAFAGVVVVVSESDYRLVQLSRVATTDATVQVSCKLYASGSIDCTDDSDDSDGSGGSGSGSGSYTNVYVRLRYDRVTSSYTDDPYGRLRYGVSTLRCPVNQSEVGAPALSGNTTVTLQSLKWLRLIAGERNSSKPWSGTCVTPLPQYFTELEMCPPDPT